MPKNITKIEELQYPFYIKIKSGIGEPVKIIENKEEFDAYQKSLYNVNGLEYSTDINQLIQNSAQELLQAYLDKKLATSYSRHVIKIADQLVVALIYDETVLVNCEE